MHRLFTAKSMKQVAEQLHFEDVDSLYTAIGAGHVSAQHVANQLMALFGDRDDAVDALASRTPLSELESSRAKQQTEDSKNGSGILVEGSPDVLAKLAKCCQPVPGDEIFGFVTRGGGVSVHRVDCTNAEKLKSEPERMMQVEWAQGKSSSGAFAATLQVEALDRQGLLFEVTKIFSESKLNVLSMRSSRGEDHIATLQFTFSVSDTKQLGALMTTLRNTEGVFDVYRVTA